MKCLLSLSLLLLGCQHAADAPHSRFPHLARFRLPGVEDDLWQGKFRVYENRTSRTGRTIDLNVVVVPALDLTDIQAPLFELAGGPGLGITASARMYATDLKD